MFTSADVPSSTGLTIMIPPRKWVPTTLAINQWSVSTNNATSSKTRLFISNIENFISNTGYITILYDYKAPASSMCGPCTTIDSIDHVHT